MIEYLNQLDVSLLLFFNSLHNSFFDVVMVFASSKFGWVPFYVFLLYLTIRQYKTKALIIILFVTILILLSDLISVYAFKNVFERLRPCHNEDIQALLHTVNGCGGLYGFVSSHATNTFAAAFFFSAVLSKYKWIVWVMYGWALLVSYSRIYLGVHFPGDVLCGAIVGTLIGWLVYYLFKTTNARVYAKTNGSKEAG